MELSITAEPDATGRHVLGLDGALDLASCGALLERAGAALGTPHLPGLVLDLSGITFIDSSGIGAIVQIAGDAEDASIPFAIRRPSERVVRVLTLSGLIDAWPVENAP
ncbi:MAG TPA: STAS domain-containing protein [Jatrophihabitantaceae bacterium]|nr:STAS domain-containing protein [Jatrophihabitantaceae bacterium]